MLERTERREKHVSAFNAKLREKQLAEMRAREAARAKAEAEARARAEELQKRQEAARQQAAREQAEARERLLQERAEAKAAKEAAKARERAEKAANKNRMDNMQRIMQQMQTVMKNHKIAAAQLIQRAAGAGLDTVPAGEIGKLRQATFASLEECCRLLGKPCDWNKIAPQLQKVEQAALQMANAQKKPSTPQETQLFPQNNQELSQQQQSMRAYDQNVSEVATPMNRQYQGGTPQQYVPSNGQNGVNGNPTASQQSSNRLQQVHGSSTQGAEMDARNYGAVGQQGQIGHISMSSRQAAQYQRSNHNSALRHPSHGVFVGEPNVVDSRRMHSSTPPFGHQQHFARSQQQPNAVGQARTGQGLAHANSKLFQALRGMSNLYFPLDVIKCILTRPSVLFPL